MPREGRCSRCQEGVKREGTGRGSSHVLGLCLQKFEDKFPVGIFQDVVLGVYMRRTLNRNLGTIGARLKIIVFCCRNLDQ